MFLPGFHTSKHHCCVLVDIDATARGPEEPGSSSTGPGGSNQGPQLVEEGRYQRSQELPEPTPSCSDRDECGVPFAVRRTGTTPFFTGSDVGVCFEVLKLSI